jgi:hypothetical protein
VFEGVAGDGFKGDIAIDDIFFDKRGPCRPPGFCSFEDSPLCLWSNSPSNTQSNNLERVRADRVDVGVDATTGTGSGHLLWALEYSIFESTADKVTVKSIESETIFGKQYPNGACFTFSHIINDYSTHVYVNRKVYPNLEFQPEFDMTGELSKTKWTRSLVDISATMQNYELQLSVEITQASGSSSVYSVALDDIMLHNKTCRQLVLDELDENSSLTCTADPKIKVPGSKVCDFIKDCPDGEDEKKCGDCDFEDSM